MLTNPQGPWCQKCPLGEALRHENRYAPVPGYKGSADIILVAGSPEASAVKYRQPFAGESQDLIDDVVPGDVDVSMTHVVACRYPGGDEKRYLAQLRKENRRRRKLGEEPLATPQACCSQRFLHEIAPYEHIITLGSAATKAVLPGNPSLMRVRGRPVEHNGVKVIATVDPWTARRERKWVSVMRSDVEKAVRFFRDRLRWADATLEDHYPTPDTLRAFLDRIREQEHPCVTYDVETDSVESLTARLRCIGIGTKDEVLVVPLLSIDGETEAYLEPPVREEILTLLRELFTDPNILKIGHNAGYFDRIVVEQHLGVTPKPLLDTILLHRAARSEYPHSLDFISSVETDVHAWKLDHTATTAKTDEELYAYCGLDVRTTAHLPEPLVRQVHERGQLNVFRQDVKLQELCVGMKCLGIRVDDGRRMAHMTRITKERDHWYHEFQRHTPGSWGRDARKINSHRDIRQLLFDTWELPPSNFTLTGEPSTDAASLRELLAGPLEDQHRSIINALRRYRKAEKLLGTYLNKLEPGLGVVDSDGRIYPDYHCHGTISGRFSSANPNFQNIPYLIRDIFIPDPGKVFVGADFDQLELRLAAALSGAGHYLGAFSERKIDPHNLTGWMMFGDKFWLVDGSPETRMGKGTGQFKDLRNLAKAICFASLYGAEPKKVHELLRSAEDKEGNLLYAHYTLREVTLLHRKWMQAAPEFKQWWGTVRKFWRTCGYVEEPIWGRRRYFHEEDFNAMINTPVQAGGFAIVAMGMLELVKHLPFNYANRTGLVNQLHDAVTLQVDEAEADYACAVTTDSLTRKLDDISVVFTADATAGYSYAEV